MPRQMEGRKDGRKNGWKDRWKDRQTLFHRTLPATAGGPINAIQNRLENYMSFSLDNKSVFIDSFNF